jgi:hypothetical protein
LNVTRKKTLAILVIAATIFVLGLAATALGEMQSKPFDSTTVPQEVIEAYKSGLPFRQYISLAIKNPESAQLIKQELGNANIECGGEGADVRTNEVVCDQAVSFMNQTCSVDPSISRNCEQIYIPEYLHAQNLNETQQSKLSYMLLARSASLNHPGTSEALLELTRLTE